MDEDYAYINARRARRAILVIVPLLLGLGILLAILGGIRFVASTSEAPVSPRPRPQPAPVVLDTKPVPAARVRAEPRPAALPAPIAADAGLASAAPVQGKYNAMCPRCATEFHLPAPKGWTAWQMDAVSYPCPFCRRKHTILSYYGFWDVNGTDLKTGRQRWDANFGQMLHAADFPAVGDGDVDRANQKALQEKAEAQRIREEERLLKEKISKIDWQEERRKEDRRLEEKKNLDAENRRRAEENARKNLEEIRRIREQIKHKR